MFSSLSLLNSSAPKSYCLFAPLQYRNCTFHCLFSFLCPHLSSQVRKLEVSTISFFFLPPMQGESKSQENVVFFILQFLNEFFFQGCSIHTTASALANLEFVVPRRAITPSQCWMRRCRRRWVGNTWTSLIVVVGTPTGEWRCEKRWTKKFKNSTAYFNFYILAFFLVAFWATPFAFF